MTPEEMVRRIMQNIEAARAALDGPCGFVLHTDDYALFLCQSETAIWLASPREGEVIVQRSCRSARCMQRYWNGRLPDADAGNDVFISLRRDALQGYIDYQQLMLDALLELGARRRHRIQLDA
jgi:hypothetical protein